MKLFPRRLAATKQSNRESALLDQGVACDMGYPEQKHLDENYYALALLVSLHIGERSDASVLDIARAWVIEGVLPTASAACQELAQGLAADHARLTRFLSQLTLPTQLRMQLAGFGIPAMNKLLSRLSECGVQSVAGMSESSSSRYLILGELGRGGRGLVLRARDQRSGREVALKRPTIDEGVSDDEAQLRCERFRQEARTASHLEHPNIVPVYDLGDDPDGTPFYVMRRLQGQTLAERNARYHATRQALVASDAPDQAAMADLAAERARLLSALLDVVKAIAYAHDQGVVHRDIKPQNIVVDGHGAGVVLDWGMAHSRNSGGDAVGVVGTPGYMAPEQTRGIAGDARSDVYSIGATLYAILCGRAPNIGKNLAETLQRTSSRPPTRPSIVLSSPATFAPEHEVPEGLEAICMRSLMLDPEQRYQSAAELRDELMKFWQGNEESRFRRTRARELAFEARAYMQEYDLALQAELQAVEELREAAAAHKAHQEWYVLQRQLRKLQRETEQKDARVAATIQKAMAFDGHETSVQDVACSYWWQKLDLAEANGEANEAALAIDQLQVFARQQDEVRLRGEGKLNLKLKGGSAEIWVYRYVDDGARLHRLPIDGPDVAEALLAPSAPVGGLCDEDDRKFCRVATGEHFSMDMPMGSYQLVVRYSVDEYYRLPVSIGRCQQVSMTLDRPVSRLPEGMQLVPGGDYICGENGGEVTRLGRRIETLPTFAIARHPVTCAEYSEFLKDLPLTEARARAPRLAQGAASMWPEVDGRLIVPTRERCEGLGLSAQQYRLETCAGDWEDNWPALSMSWDDAQAFAEWKSQREGVKYRLPTEWEWEKAARGVDGRVFPWGEEFEPEWTNSIYSFEDGQRVVSVNQFPVDESPYGVRGMGGNTRDWCADSVPENPQMRMLRGGLWTGAGLLLRPALRVGNIHSRVTTSVGFRLAMDV